MCGIAQSDEREANYRRALAQLPPRERELLVLHLELHCSHRAIAAALGVPSADAARKRIARALAQLESRLARSEG